MKNNKCLKLKIKTKSVNGENDKLQGQIVNNSFYKNHIIEPKRDIAKPLIKKQVQK